MANNIQKIELFGVKLDSMAFSDSIDKICHLSDKKGSSIICTVNVEFIMRAQKDQNFMDILNNKSSLNLIDGAGIVWGYALKNSWRPKIEVINQLYVTIHFLFYLLLYPIIIQHLLRKFPKASGSDIIWEIAKKCSENKKTIFLLGNKNGLDPNSAQKASLILQTKIFDLKVAGTLSSTSSPDDEKHIIEIIKKSEADLLLCSFGSPDQEFWLSKNLSKSGCRVGIGLGGTFDFISGGQKRAPKFIRLLGFEWLYRLIRQPKRIKRQVAIFQFIRKIYFERMNF